MTQQTTMRFAGLRCVIPLLNKTAYYCNQTIKLREGNVIKLGKVKFLVRKVNHFQTDKIDINESNALVFRQDTKKDSSLLLVENIFTDKRPICRICLEKESFSGNPLVCPCSCSGSIRAIHLKCLQLSFTYN